MFYYRSNQQQEKGQGLVEYALILVLVAIVVIVALSVLGPIIGGVFSDVNGSLSGVSGGGSEAPQTVTNESCSAVHSGGYATGPGYGYACFAPGVGGYNP